MSILSQMQQQFHNEFNKWWKSDKNIWGTHQRFGEHVGVSESSIGDYLSGKTTPTGERARKICDAIGLDSLSPLSGSLSPSEPDFGTPLDDTPQGSLLSPAEPDETPYKTFRLGVSGDVVLRKIECAIIDTRIFQRLRSIKQLGTSYLVYPSATHTRFEHSIGTLHEAARMIDCIKNNPGSLPKQQHISKWDEQIIRLAALLHDIGHVPFGHTLEDETLTIEPKHDNDIVRRNALLVDSPIGEILKKEIGNDLFSLLIRIISTSHKDVGKLGEHAYISDIVNNTLCADLLDYLKRDVYFCNLNDKFGDRFMNYLYLDEVHNSEVPVTNGGPTTARRLIIRLWKKESSRHRRDVLSELTDLLRTRYTLGEKVYFHHAKVSSSAMVARAVWSDMRNSGRVSLSNEKLYKMGDDELLQHLSNSGDVVAQKLGNSILGRQLHKMAYTLTRTEADAATGIDWTGKMISEYHDDPENRTRVEDQIASLCGLERGDVLIYCPDRDMGKKYARMLVEWKGNYQVLRDIDDPATKPSLLAIETSHELLWNLQVFIKPSAMQDEKCRGTLLDLCESKFSPFKNPRDAERRFESALRNIVNEKIGARGTSADADTVVSKLVSVSRGGSELITLPDISDVIKETLGA